MQKIKAGLDKMKSMLTKQYSPRVYRTYYTKFLFCEALNLVNAIVQIFFIDLFLGGMFTEHGTAIWEISGEDPESRYDPMALVFPKVTKCTFHKFGPSGSIQVPQRSHDLKTETHLFENLETCRTLTASACSP